MRVAVATDAPRRVVDVRTGNSTDEVSRPHMGTSSPPTALSGARETASNSPPALVTVYDSPNAPRSIVPNARFSPKARYTLEPAAPATVPRSSVREPGSKSTGRSMPFASTTTNCVVSFVILNGLRSRGTRNDAVKGKASIRKPAAATPCARCWRGRSRETTIESDSVASR